MRRKSVFIFVLVVLNCRLIWAQNYSMPFRFEANQGQADARISYIARGGSYTADLNQNEVVIHVGPESVQMRFAGGKRATAIEPMEELPERTNYYGGNREDWFTDIKNYRRVVYRHVYPDIDVAFRSEGHSLEFDFVAAASSDVKPIALDFSGQKSLKITDSGNLQIELESGDLQLHRPVIYQDHDGRRSAVDGRFVQRGRKIGIEVGDYDKSSPLVIDPKMTYSTYAGGSGAETPTGIAIDGAGNIYVVFRVSYADDKTAGESFWVIKLARDGSAGYFTELGTYFTGQAGTAIAVDSSRNVYVTGVAALWPPNSGHPQFPTLNPIQREAGGGGSDAIIAKLDPAGKLVFSTLWGGSGDESAEDVKLDNEGNIYITGFTSSPDFPRKHDCSALSGKSDVFVTKISADLKTVIFSILLGGDGYDGAGRLVLDSSGTIYLAGSTTSSIFPGYPGNLPSSSTNVFVTRLNPAATAVLSTWIQSDAHLIDFALDPSGARYVLYKSSGTPQYILSEQSANGTAGYAVSFQGIPSALAVDADGTAYVTGADSSDVFVEKITASNHADPKGRNFDLYMINDDGSGLERVTYNDTFDGFPLFSRDGRKLVFASNRGAGKPGETNIFIADWVQ